MVLHRKEARNKNMNLVAFRIPIDLSVTLRKLGVDPKAVCIQALQQIAFQNRLNDRSSETGLKTGLKLEKVAGPGGVEPPTLGLGGRCPILARPRAQQFFAQGTN